MSETLPPPPASELEYRPLSALAVAGFALSALFAAIVVVGAIASWRQSAPLLLTPYLYALPLVGAVLCFLARNQIRQAEDTRAGWELTRWGLRLCVLTGLGYFIYSYFTGLALTQQANTFLLNITKDELGKDTLDSGFFPRLEASRADPIALKAAFLLTQPSDYRRNVKSYLEKPETFRLNFEQTGAEGAPSPFKRFRDSQLAQIFNPGPGDSIKVEAQGVQSWTYADKSYQVQRQYRVTNAEGVFEFVIPVRSSEASAEGGGRQWHVEWHTASLVPPKPSNLTELGRRMMLARFQARVAVEEAFAKLNQGESWPHYPDLDKTDWTRIDGGEELRRHLQAKLHDMFAGAGKNRVYAQPETEVSQCAWETKNGLTRVHLPIKAGTQPGGKFGHYQVDGIALVDSAAPLDDVSVKAMKWNVAGFLWQRASPLIKGIPKKQ